MNCKKCNKEVVQGKKFCGFCGAETLENYVMIEKTKLKEFLRTEEDIKEIDGYMKEEKKRISDLSEDMKKINNGLLWFFGIVVMYKIIFNNDSFWTVVVAIGISLIVISFVCRWLLGSNNK